MYISTDPCWLKFPSGCWWLQQTRDHITLYFRGSKVLPQNIGSYYFVVEAWRYHGKKVGPKRLVNSRKKDLYNLIYRFLFTVEKQITTKWKLVRFPLIILIIMDVKIIIISISVHMEKFSIKGYEVFLTSLLIVCDFFFFCFPVITFWLLIFYVWCVCGLLFDQFCDSVSQN